MNQPIIEIQATAEIPKNLESKSPEDKVQSQSLAVAALHQLEPGQVQAVKEMFSVIEWKPDLVNRLCAIGFDCEKVGISRINKGSLLVGQEAIIRAIEACTNLLAEAKSATAKLKIMGMLAKLNSSLAENVKASGVDQVAESLAKDGKIRRASPAKGAPMGPATNIVSVLPEVKTG